MMVVTSSIRKKNTKNNNIASVQQCKVPIMGILKLMELDWYLVDSGLSVLKSQRGI
jgi:hypothetical protein